VSKMAPLPESFFRELPKVELHCHLLGSVQRATLTDWVRRAKAPISMEEIESFYTRGDKPVGVLRVLRALERELMRAPEDLERLTLEYLQSAAAHRVRYAEFFWNPTGAARDSGIRYGDGLAAIRRAIADAETAWGITGRLIPAIDREASPDEALEMVGWVVAHPCDEVVGLGIDYRETDRPPELFAAAFALAKRHGLKATAHAGEFGCPWTHVRTAVELLKVDRIDHGYTIVDAPEVARELAARGIVFTVVPTNSYYLRTLPRERWTLDHPIRAMPAFGLAIHPNTDDPTLHLVTPSEAWRKMHADFGFGVDALRAFMRHGLDGAWIDATTRARWGREFEQGFDAALAAAVTPAPAPAPAAPGGAATAGC
jgi:adenine deaminase